MSNSSPPQPADSLPLAAPAAPASPDAGERRAGRRLMASSATVSIFNGLGVAAGFALDAIIAALFGVGAQTDAFFSAWRTPYLMTVVLGMAASSTLVPIFARDAAAADADGLSTFFSHVFNAVVLLMALLAAAGVLLSPWLVGSLFGGLPAASLELAASLSRVLFLTLLFTGAVEVLRSLLYAHQVFAIPTAINFVRSVVVIAVLLVGRLALSAPATITDWTALHLLAWGYVAGVVAQLLVVGWQARQRTSLRWRPLLDLRHPRLRQTIRLSAAPTGGAIVRQTIGLAEVVIASYLPVGSVTVLNYANRLTFVLSSVFLSSITTASMPMLSRAIGAARSLEVRQTLLSALRLVAFLALPLGVSLAALGAPVIRLLFERGRFTVEASRLTGSVLSFYALSILFLGYFRVIQAYFYAALKATTVLLLFVVMALTAVGLDLWLSGPLGVQGIAIGFSVSTLLSTGLGLWLLQREISASGRPETTAAQRPLASLLLLNGKVAIASLALALATRGVLALLPGLSWALLPALAVGSVAFVLTALLLRIRELQMAWEVVQRKRRRARPLPTPPL